MSLKQKKRNFSVNKLRLQKPKWPSIGPGVLIVLAFYIFEQTRFSKKSAELVPAKTKEKNYGFFSVVPEAWHACMQFKNHLSISYDHPSHAWKEQRAKNELNHLCLYEIDRKKGRERDPFFGSILEKETNRLLWTLHWLSKPSKW